MKPQFELLTLAEAVRALRVCRATLYRRVLRPGGLRTVTIGKSVRVRRSDLDAYLDALASKAA